MTAKIPTVIGLGRLIDFIIRDAQGQRLRVTPADERWLAWKPDTRDLVVLRPGQGQESHIERKAALRHEKFHGATLKHVRQMEWPKARGRVRTIGLIESVTYCANGIYSPSKGLHHWVHQFGDRGQRGHGPTQAIPISNLAQRFFPKLMNDHDGNLYIIRVPGNQFTVQDWIVG